MEEYSYSKLTRFEECPLSYMRKYINLEEPYSHGITESGLFMHNLLEMYENGILKKEELLKYFEDNFDRNITSTTSLKMSETFSKDMYGLYYTGYHKYLEEFDGIKDCKEIIDVENEFHLTYNNDYNITGKIDLVFINNDNELCILDHKSKNKFKSKKDQAKYARQLYIYAWASNIIYGKYPKWLIFNMLRGDYIYIEFNKDDMNESLEWFNNTVQEIRDSITYDANKDTFYCWNWCCLDECELCNM